MSIFTQYMQLLNRTRDGSNIPLITSPLQLRFRRPSSDVYDYYDYMIMIVIMFEITALHKSLKNINTRICPEFSKLGWRRILLGGSVAAAALNACKL